MLELLGLLTLVLSVWGNVLINRRDRRGFAIWIASNACSLAVHWQTGVWAMSARDVIFAALAIDGMARWGRAEKH